MKKIGLFLLGLLSIKARSAQSIDSRSNGQRADLRATVRPNILFIFADDIRADALGSYGNTYVKTPVLDSLAQEGTSFTRAYILGGHHGAICAPSWAMLMSGQSYFRVWNKLDGVHTLPMHLRERGYTAFLNATATSLRSPLPRSSPCPGTTVPSSASPINGNRSI